MFRWIPIQTFRYLACGGFNAFLSIFIYHISYTYFFTAKLSYTYLVGKEKFIYLFGNSDINIIYVANMVAMVIGVPIGFVLSRHIVFPESNIHGRVQLFRYIIAAITFVILNYVLMGVLEKIIPYIHPTIRTTFITIIIAILSYISQRVFTFKVVKTEPIVQE